MTQKSWNDTLDEFINDVSFFRKKTYIKFSPEIRGHINLLLIGLCLPCIRGRRQRIWGYELSTKYENVYVPTNEGKELKILGQAIVMHNSEDYYIEDVVGWLNTAVPHAPMSVETFYHILRERPLFPESLGPLEARIQTFLNGLPGQHNRFAPTSKKGKEETSDEEGEGGDEGDS